MNLVVKVDPQFLIKKLEYFKSRYTKTRETLLKAYKKKVEKYKKEFNEFTSQVLEGKKIREKPVPPAVPEDRTEEYDLYIEMLKHHTGFVEIDENTFRKIVFDKWNFIKEHIFALQAYSVDDLAANNALQMYTGVIGEY